MPEASLDWKIQCLRVIQNMPAGAGFTPDTNSKQELIWIQDLERDGHISAKFRMGYHLGSQDTFEGNVPNMIWDAHILDKGRQLIDDYESQRTVKGIWKRYHQLILGWILGIASALIIVYLTHAFFH